MSRATGRRAPFRGAPLAGPRLIIMECQNIMRTRVRFLAVVGAAALTAAGGCAASTARAQTALPNTICASGVGAVTICGTGALQLVPVGGMGATVVFSCTAFTEFPVLDTNTDCYARGADGTRISATNVWAPGDAAATAGSSGARVVPLQQYQLCISGEYVDLNGERGSGSNGLATLTGCIADLP